MEGKAIEIDCMKFFLHCLTWDSLLTYLHAPIQWPRHGPAHWVFCFWCFTVTSQKNSPHRWVDVPVKQHHLEALENWHWCMYYFHKCSPSKSILRWPLRNLLTSKYHENNLFKKFNSHFICTCHTSLALTGLTYVSSSAGVQQRRKHFTNPFQVPVSRPQSRPGLRAISAHFVETGPPQAHQHVDWGRHSLFLTNRHQTAA